MIKRILTLILLGCLAAPVAAVSGVSFDPSVTPFTARKVGMGGVGVGFANDAAGIFTNPSGLAAIKFPQLTATSRKLVLDETQYNLIGWAMPTDYGTFGLGYVSMGTGGSLPTMLDPGSGRIIVNPSGEVTSYGNSVTVISYSKAVNIQQLKKPISLGANLKFFNQGLSGGVNSSASSMGLDLGATYQASPWLSVGANLQNILEGNMQWSGGDSDTVGGYYKLGCRMNILGSKEALVEHDHLLYGGIDMDIPHSSLSSTQYHLGVEYFPMQKVALRSGINMEDGGAGFTLGIGLFNGGFRFDYAYAQRPGIPGDGPHYFSLSYVGEQTVRYVRDKKPKRRESLVRFFKPKDRSITDASSTIISAEARQRKVFDLKTIFEVTAVSSTYEVREVEEIEDLTPVYLNGIKLDQVGTISATSPLHLGRNLFQLTGFSSPEYFPGVGTPEIFSGSGEAKVLRFVPFSDTPMSYWALEPIALSVTLGLVKGYPDDTFRPEKGITRAELVTLLVRSLPGVDTEQEIKETPFKDVSAKHWAAKFITIGSENKLVDGYPDGTFKPNRVLTRAEGVTILTRYAALITEKAFSVPFPDLKEGYWANKYIAAAKEGGLLNYLAGKDFEPSKPFPRAEAAEVLYRTPRIERRVDQFWETGVISAQQVEIRKAKPVSPEAATTIETRPAATGEAEPATKPATAEGQ